MRHSRNENKEKGGKSQPIVSFLYTDKVPNVARINS